MARYYIRLSLGKSLADMLGVILAQKLRFDMVVYLLYRPSQDEYSS